jgi:sulfite reductase (NADPH) flavoprotein alpha-component
MFGVFHLQVYVQHRMREQGPLLAQLVVDQQCYFFVCGDGAHMAVDVQNTLIDILVAHRGLTPDTARAFVMQMIVDKRYVADVWS